MLMTDSIVWFVSQVSKFLRGEVGVLFTNKTKDEVQEYVLISLTFRHQLICFDNLYINLFVIHFHHLASLMGIKLISRQ